MATVAELVRERVRSIPTGEFVHSRDLVDDLGSRGAVDVALHRAHVGEHLVLVRRGLYYKGKPTRFGTTRPDPYRVALEVAKAAGHDGGVGPAGYSAARALGLTTQVPPSAEVSVPGRAPKDLRGVHFTSRSPVARRSLRELEVAVLEMLREWPRYSEESWLVFVDRVRDLARSGRVDPAAVRTVARREHHAQARELADRLCREVGDSVAART
jgi:hypothetical protein